MGALLVSVVVFDSSRATLRALLASLSRAAKTALNAAVISRVALVLVDNSPSGQGRHLLDDLCTELAESGTWDGRISFAILHGHGNIGYGCGNNLALQGGQDSDFSLVLNPDVELEEQALVTGIRYLQANPGVVLLAPAVVLADGTLSHLCKAYPSVLDLLLRGFAPAALKRCFRQRLDAYTLSALARRPMPREVAIVSGSFMLCRSTALARIGGFDPGYFLYFEDFDLSLRIAAEGAVHWLPALHIRHAGGHTARKGPWHLWQFVRSGVRFFNRHGWRLF